MDEYQRILSRRVRALREQSWLTQEQVAAFVGIKRWAIVEIERGQRNISAEELLRFSRLFRISCEQLLDPSKEPRMPIRKLAPKRRRRGEAPAEPPGTDERKLREVLLHLLCRAGARPSVGEIVIARLLYFADLDHFEKHGVPLFGGCFVRDDHGPAPAELRRVISEMVETEELELVRSAHFAYPNTKYLPRREADLACLSGAELATVDAALERLAHLGAARITAHARGDSPWTSAEPGSALDHAAALDRPLHYSVRDGDASVAAPDQRTGRRHT